MEYKTYADLKLRAQERIDIQDEVFVDDDELLRYCQEAIDYCEDKIHTGHAADRYFETVANLAIVQGQSEYSLPSNIYANKILRIVHDRSDDIYEIRRLTRKDRYQDLAILDRYGSTNLLSYMILNHDPTAKPVIRLTPRPGFTTSTVSTTITTTSGSKTATVASATGLAVGYFISATGLAGNCRIDSINGNTVVMTMAAQASGTDVALTATAPDVLIYYIRSANKPTSDTSVIDIPEFYHFIVQYMIVECLKKDSGNPRLQDEKEKLADLQENMVSTLANMVPDETSGVEADDSFNREMS